MRRVTCPEFSAAGRVHDRVHASPSRRDQSSPSTRKDRAGALARQGRHEHLPLRQRVASSSAVRYSTCSTSSTTFIQSLVGGCLPRSRCELGGICGVGSSKSDIIKNCPGGCISMARKPGNFVQSCVSAAGSSGERLRWLGTVHAQKMQAHSVGVCAV